MLRLLENAYVSVISSNVSIQLEINLKFHQTLRCHHRSIKLFSSFLITFPWYS